MRFDEVFSVKGGSDPAAKEGDGLEDREYETWDRGKGGSHTCGDQNDTILQDWANYHGFSVVVRNQAKIISRKCSIPCPDCRMMIALRQYQVSMRFD